MPEKLIVFTRYPEPGKAKTRLIPALGATGAANLSRQMTERTLTQVRTLQLQRQPPHALLVEIAFAGGTLKEMQNWLGQDWSYTAQGGSDLGERMARSLQSAFDSGMQRAVLIGTDCPALDAALLEKAFHALSRVDLVLGPAMDGGYYLIGLRRPVPELFRGIAWSTTTVLSHTMQIAERLGLAIAQLPTLSDIDYPEDLAIWAQIQSEANS